MPAALNAGNGKPVPRVAESDHRSVGEKQKLFFFDGKLSPGSAFFLPNGQWIRQKLVGAIRCEYRERGFVEVSSPNIFKGDLFKQSGHHGCYRKDMYLFPVGRHGDGDGGADGEGSEVWGLKPMNCPGHALIYKHLAPRAADLPLRLAEFGVIHRNELSGALCGLQRVRRFVQDDAHVFCRCDQIGAEVRANLQFVEAMYRSLGLPYRLVLGSRPEHKFIGELEQWSVAERQLQEVLDEVAGPGNWRVDAGGGAFYGPKIDVLVRGRDGKESQCASVQLDFQLPQRFGLRYLVDQRGVESVESADSDPSHVPAEGGEEEEKKKCGVPVMIHRAVLGSLERMIAVLAEAHNGQWPFWLSPWQAVILPAKWGGAAEAYARCVHQKLLGAGFAVKLDGRRSKNLRGKMKDAVKRACARHGDGSIAVPAEPVHFILVVGDREAKNGSVQVKRRLAADGGPGPWQKKPVEMRLDELLALFGRLADHRQRQ